MSRHHIIPFNLLRDFYNTVVQRRRLSLLGAFLNTFSRFIPFYAGAAAGQQICLADRVNLVGAVTLAISLANGVVEAGGENLPEYFDSFESFYVWMPWNLFIGPSGDWRSDDPGPGFETQASHIVNNEQRWNMITSVATDMITYIVHPDNVTLMCQHFLGHTIKQLFELPRILQVINNH